MLVVRQIGTLHPVFLYPPLTLAFLEKIPVTAKNGAGDETKFAKTHHREERDQLENKQKLIRTNLRHHQNFSCLAG